MRESCAKMILTRSANGFLMTTSKQKNVAKKINVTETSFVRESHRKNSKKTRRGAASGGRKERINLQHDRSIVREHSGS